MGTHEDFINFGSYVILRINSKEPNVFVFVVSLYYHSAKQV